MFVFLSGCSRNLWLLLDLYFPKTLTNSPFLPALKAKKVIIVWLIYFTNKKWIKYSARTRCNPSVIINNYIHLNRTCLTSLQKQRAHCTEPTRYGPRPIYCLQMTSLASDTAHPLDMDKNTSTFSTNPLEQGHLVFGH